jgi:hypothetical protein
MGGCRSQASTSEAVEKKEQQSRCQSSLVDMGCLGCGVGITSYQLRARTRTRGARTALEFRSPEPNTNTPCVEQMSCFWWVLAGAPAETPD